MHQFLELHLNKHIWSGILAVMIIWDILLIFPISQIKRPGLNTKRSGLRKLFKLIKSGKVARVVITFKDRLTRFGFEYILQYCAIFNVSIVALKNSLGKTVQQELVDDMMSLIACFSWKLYGLRSRQSRAEKKSGVKS